KLDAQRPPVAERFHCFAAALVVTQRDHPLDLRAGEQGGETSAEAFGQRHVYFAASASSAISSKLIACVRASSSCVNRNRAARSSAPSMRSSARPKILPKIGWL